MDGCVQEACEENREERAKSFLIQGPLLNAVAVLLNTGGAAGVGGVAGGWVGGGRTESWSRLGSPLMHSRRLTCFCSFCDLPPPPEKEKPDLSLQEARKVRVAGHPDILWDLVKCSTISPSHQLQRE